GRVGQGCGWLVGEWGVMAGRHVMLGACRASVRVDGATFAARRWVNWYSNGTSASAADVATIKLDEPAAGAYVFRIRSSMPPLGTNLSAVGYPLGNRLSLNQGKLIQRVYLHAAPVVAVKMLG